MPAAIPGSNLRSISGNSRSCGLLKGLTIDISESGIAAMLTLEAPLREIVELDFTLPSGPVMIFAAARQRNAFRYGFEFIDVFIFLFTKLCVYAKKAG